MLKAILIAATALSAFVVNAEPLKKKQLSAEQRRAIQIHQRAVRSEFRVAAKQEEIPARPFSEMEEAGYLFFSADFDFDSREAKRTMAKNLPAGVTLVIFADQGTSRHEVLSEFSDVIDESRVKVITLPGASRGFWARDGLPVAVWSQKGQMEFVDSKYFHGFEPDQDLAKAYQARLIRNKYYFEGGNFMTNDTGACITVDNSDSQEIPDDVFTEKYGCKKLVRLPFEKGIGHVDESVRFVNSQRVVTDSESYAARLKSEGFDVLLLPRPENEYETYVNALVIGNLIYVPVFGQDNDKKALDVYRSAGLTAIPIRTNELANDGLGSLHCITMTYPKVPFKDLVKSLGGREL